jgi:ApaG protein
MAAAYEATTRGVVVRVRPHYLPAQSDPDEGRWVWRYDIELENRGSDTVQLIARHWIITDASGRVEEVQGLGVVGDQPTLGPGDSYSYASGCPLPTSSGAMTGSYLMITSSGEQFEAEIPTFSLDLPDTPRTLN